MNIRSDLRQIREAHGLTQTQLAQAIGVCTRTISNAETCKERTPSIPIALMLAEYFHMTVEDIFHIE